MLSWIALTVSIIALVICTYNLGKINGKNEMLEHLFSEKKEEKDDEED